VDPQHCKVEFENAHVRVLHWTTGAHEKSPMHSHPAMVTIFLTDSHTKFTLPDGTTQERHGKAGQAVWSDAESHSSESLNDRTTEAIQVELKGRHHVAAAKKEPAAR
jgi:quercetin dioxygenase-like cupin family protein